MINIKKDTIVIIPAFNEEQSISLVLNELKNCSCAHRFIQIIVVNNNSQDNTKIIAQKNGAFVVDEPILGYGKACLSGLKQAYLHSPDNIVFLDADFSDSPSEVNYLLEQIDKGSELVIGSRTLGKAQKGSLLPQAIFGNWLATNLIFYFLGGDKFTDLGPFRAIKTTCLQRIAMQDEDFGWTVEMQIKAVLYRLKCSEVSVSYKKRIGVSKITGTISGSFKAGIKILSLIFKYAILTRLNGKYFIKNNL